MTQLLQGGLTHEFICTNFVGTVSGSFECWQDFDFIPNYCSTFLSMLILSHTCTFCKCKSDDYCTCLLCNSSIDCTPIKCYNKDTAREARPKGKGRRMYRERKSRTPAKTVTHFLISCIKENGPATATNETTEPNPPKGQAHYTGADPQSKARTV